MRVFDGPRDFLRVGEDIGAVDLPQVDIFRAQTRQAVVNGFGQIFRAAVVWRRRVRPCRCARLGAGVATNR